MQWLQAPNISIPHGFSTRSGGVSEGPFASLNLGGHEDEQENIARNRERALTWLGLEKGVLSVVKQVHGCDVHPGGEGMKMGDAQVTSEPGIHLVVHVADCYPILFHDPEKKVIGVAHAGWRGTLGGIAGKTVQEMEKLGADASSIKVAIGPGISAEKFVVGKEVIFDFSEAGFPDACFQGNRIDLTEANRYTLINSGIRPENIWMAGRCSFEDDFFSYRRDKGLTGRMWGIISL